MASDKAAQYRELVDRRKRCSLCPGLCNPSAVDGGSLDSDEIGPWSRWQGNLGAPMMIVGQDWGDITYFRTNHGREAPRNPTNSNLVRLLGMAGYRITESPGGGKTLDTWLREKFFTQHCRLFQHRPFIWHIWDALRDGFAALVNYHKLDHKLLETLIYTYLGDWIGRQKQDIASGLDGASERLAAAEGLKRRLELILEGEDPYDIFVRWKPIEEQPVGWNPDLDDGVRINIRPFMSVPDVGRKGAGVLRDKPNINWNKDRGKDVESAPWYHLFKGDRINDHHLTLAEKRAARERKS